MTTFANIMARNPIDRNDPSTLLQRSSNVLSVYSLTAKALAALHADGQVYKELRPDMVELSGNHERVTFIETEGSYVAINTPGPGYKRSDVQNDWHDVAPELIHDPGGLAPHWFTIFTAESNIYALASMLTLPETGRWNLYLETYHPILSRYLHKALAQKPSDRPSIQALVEAIALSKEVAILLHSDAPDLATLKSNMTDAINGTTTLGTLLQTLIHTDLLSKECLTQLFGFYKKADQQDLAEFIEALAFVIAKETRDELKKSLTDLFKVVVQNPVEWKAENTARFGEMKKAVIYAKDSFSKTDKRLAPRHKQHDKRRAAAIKLLIGFAKDRAPELSRGERRAAHDHRLFAMPPRRSMLHCIARKARP